MKLKAFRMIPFFILALLSCSCNHEKNFSSGTEQIPATKTEFSLEEQVQAAEALLKRVVGNASSSFKVVVSPKLKGGRDWFRYSESDHKILLEGNNGISVASALGEYLKTECGWHYSWCGKDIALPQNLPMPEVPVEKFSPYKYRYYLNYCTFNYSMSWWDFDRWQQEIDFMALNGINMPLAVTGQNSVWRRVYNQLGFTDEELESFFSGPAHFNWFWMGNLDGWGGPLPQSFMDKHEELQKHILFAERSLGMTPILPAFTGHVPPTFTERYPEVKVKKTKWGSFDEVNILEPEEEMFEKIGHLFLEEQTKLYGTNHFYTADVFNEMTPPRNDSLYLNDISAKVYKGMHDVDKDAVWVMQAWLFHYNWKFWKNEQIEATLNAIPDDKMLILDLYSERNPVWNRTEAYFGKPWIWCMLQNFGKNISFSGNATSVANDPAETLADPKSGNMKGIGLTMEGIEQNPAIYALMLENVWRDRPIDIDTFITSYVKSRYGQMYDEAWKAWKILFSTVYENNLTEGGPESIVTARPQFTLNPGIFTDTRLHYDNNDLLKSWDLLHSLSDELQGRDCYRFDLVDVTRQCMANYATVLQQRAALCYHNRDLAGLSTSSEEFLQLINDMDELLSSRHEFLLGHWLEDAKAMGDTEEEKQLYERSARDLITLWADRDNSLAEYACKQWSGLLNGFYYKRWEMFFNDVIESMACNRSFNQDQFNEKSKDFEWKWVNSSESYPVETAGDEILVAERMYSKYREMMNVSLSTSLGNHDN